MEFFHRRLFTLFLLATSLLSACSPAVTTPPAAPAQPTLTPAPTILPTASSISMKDGLGRTVTLPHTPNRIISLAPSNTEILFAIGAGSLIVGRDSYSDYPEEAKTIQDIGGPSFGSSMEMITKLQPDLILAAEINSAEQVAEFEKLGFTIFYLTNPKEITDLYTNLETVGQLTGHEKEAAVLVESLKNRVTAVDNKIAKAASKPKVFYEVDGTDPAKPWTTGPGSFMDKMIIRAGGQNAGAGLPIQWAQISQEELIVQDPDLILLGDAKYGTSAEMVKKRAGWEAIKAVKNDNIISFNDDLASRPGPRLVDGLEALAQAIHPELFK